MQAITVSRGERRSPGARCAGPRIAVQGPEVEEHLGAERVEVEKPHPLQEAEFFFDDDRFVAVLEEVADALVAAIEGVPQGGMGRERTLGGSGRVPVRTKRWAWFKRSAQAWTARAACCASAASRATKSSRSVSSLKMTRRSIPVTI